MKTKKIFLLLFTSLTMFSFMPRNIFSEINTSEKKIIKVGYYIAPGFQDYDEKTKTYSGSSYEYLMAIKQYTNWDYEFIPVSFSEGVQMLLDGELDLMNNVSITEERKEKLSFSDYASGKNYGCLIVDKENKTYAYQDFSSFHGMKVGMLKSSIFKPYFIQYCKEHKIGRASCRERV